MASLKRTKLIDKMPKQLIPAAQRAFNAWIRQRDKDMPCISCGGRVEQAGHYYSAGHHGALRFNENNVHGQCVRCNHFLHGNLTNYRNGLIKRIGENKVLLLDATCRYKKKWTKFELLGILSKYK